MLNENVFFLFYSHLRETLFDKNVKGPFTLALCDNLAQVLIYPISRLLDIETFLNTFVGSFDVNVSMCNSLSYYYQYVFKTVDKYHKCFIKKTSKPMHPKIFKLCCFFIDFFSYNDNTTEIDVECTYFQNSEFCLFCIKFCSQVA